jgi:hypothetical protein
MNKAQQIYSKINNKPFSYGESISMILEQNGKPVSALPNEDFVFPDNSVIRVTNSGVSLLEFLVE